ncbi:hypothetical protein B0T10DRAFT_467844 [Thelonectria olida]|uniref:Uncharacterized protein n=1 Tax=Thelonectria olida TaxID=1576542 RepID=A0A9P9AGC9_9HYPO|nr:hypothetical protein B0T10DRAFT_467844 [Thelonectria olida]
MDPSSITGVVLSLTVSCGKAAAGLNSLKEIWDVSSLGLTSLAAECATLGATLSVLEGTLSRQPPSRSSDEANLVLFGENGTVTEAPHNSIRCCFMTISELNDEIAEIQKHTITNGTLSVRG